MMKQARARKKINNYLIHLDQNLGSGAYGKVYGCLEETSGRIIAVKVIEKSQFKDNPYMAEAAKQQLAIHRSLDHPNIVKVIDVVQTHNNYYVFMEFCQNGNLRSLLVKYKQLSEQDAIHCIRCICRAFQPMFEKGILHRDLKPQNILLQQNTLKVTDFGFAKALSSSRQMTRTVIGTPFYMSPQILSKQPYSSKCDVWSVGVIFFQLLTGTHPWTARSMPQLFRNIMASPQPKFPQGIDISQSSKTFICKCLKIQQTERYTWLEIFQSDIMGEQFLEIATNWRRSYESAAQKLNQLKQNIQLQALLGVFLKLKVDSLNFSQFTRIMKGLIPSVEEKQFGPMYELFDKDSNGVIDLQQFVGPLSNAPKQILELLTKLINRGYNYKQLSNRETFLRLVSDLRENPQICEQVFSLINNMEMNDD